jgi:hypothetical protein
LVKIGAANIVYPGKNSENQAVSPASPVDDPKPAYDERDKGWRTFAGCPRRGLIEIKFTASGWRRAGAKVVTSIAKS